jgi:hypothetical protein
VFEQGKKHTAYRARFARDKESGQSLLDSIAITDDEKPLFDDIMLSGCSQVFIKLSPWARKIKNAFRYNVSFGDIKATGTVESVLGDIITDTSLSLTPGDLAGHTLVFDSGPYEGDEVEIRNNTTDTIQVALPPPPEVIGLDYKVFDPAERFVLMEVIISERWDQNMIEAAEDAIFNALVSYWIKEWYLINRYMDDASLESLKYEEHLIAVRNALSHGLGVYQRSTSILR